MDKKIILSILIVAFIGIVAATYQIDINNDTFNPLASVTPEDTPVTDALAAPASDGDSANTQQVDQAQQQVDQANTQQAQAQDNSENQGNNTGNSNNTGSSRELITSENPVSTPNNGNDGSDTGNTGEDNSNGELNNQNGRSDNQNGRSDNQNGRSDNPNGGLGEIITQKPSTIPDSTSFDTELTLTQSNNIVQKSGLNIVVDYSSVQTIVGNDGISYYVYLVKYTDSKPDDEPMHLYVSKVDGSMFILEEASHPDVAPVNDSNQATDTNSTT